MPNESLDGFQFIDLFAGAGGFTLGLEAAGGTQRSIAVESDPDCAETFRSNFPQVELLVADVREVVYTTRPIDLVVAGPPCQGFSTLNRERQGDPRNLLYTEVVRCVDAVDPRMVVVENVQKFVESDECLALIAGLRKRGFSVRADVVNAADYGVPQRRLRALVVAARSGDTLPWPAATHSAKEGRLHTHRTVADAFALLPTEPDGRNWHRNDYPRRSSQIERLRAVREGGSRRDLPPDLVLNCWKEADGYNDVLGRLKWHRPATTVRTEFFRPEKGRFLHPSADRPITPREAARLQSFPDAFIFPDTQTLYSVGRQIGNAIPPLLAEAIGKAVNVSLRGAARLATGKRRRANKAVAS